MPAVSAGTLDITTLQLYLLGQYFKLSMTWAFFKVSYAFLKSVANFECIFLHKNFITYDAKKKSVSMEFPLD